MRCEVHCPPAVSVLRGPLLAAAGLAAVSLGVYAVDAVASFLAAVVAVILAVDAAGVLVLVRVLRYGGLRKPPARPRACSSIRVSAALPAAPLAIEPPRPVLDGVAVAEADKVRP